MSDQLADENVETSKSPIATQSTDEQGNNVSDTDNRSSTMHYVGNTWLCQDSTGAYMQYDGTNWIPYPGELQFENGVWILTESDGKRKIYSETESAWIDEGPTGQPRIRTDPEDGTRYEWDAVRKAWIPMVTEDFIAHYQSMYGEYSDSGSSQSAGDSKKQPTVPVETKEERRKRIREEEKSRGWMEMDESKNTNVYVSGLPLDITDDEFKELMSKYGVIQNDPRNDKPKLKLYRDEEGNVKGDGRCCYAKVESVEMSVDIMDGMVLRGKTISVQPAHFELKGDYDPKKKRRKLTAAQKKRFIDSQQRLFDWKPEQLRDRRPLSDLTVVLTNCFSLDEFLGNAARLLDLKEELRIECAKHGVVKKIKVYDNNPDGIATVTYETAASADNCITMMNYRILNGRQLRAARWDGHTKYHCAETAEERQQRLQQWEKFLDNENVTNAAKNDE